jgi:hypothetical protein
MIVRTTLIIAALLALNSQPVKAASQPVDPAKAPIAAVDRFSDSAGTLLRRSADNHLPGPNEPIDFDTPPSGLIPSDNFNVWGFSPAGEPALYYHLDVQSTTPAAVYILYHEGEDKPVQNQLDIIDTLPGEKGYNDFRQVWKVWVPKDYVANTITDASMLQQAGYKMEKTDKLLNMAIVPDKSRARVRFNGGNPELQSAWYRGEVAKFFLFDEAPLSVSGDKVPVSPIYDGFTINPGQPGGEMEFCTDPNSTQTHNVVATMPGDNGYSPLWLRVVYDSAACPSVHSLETALQAKKVAANVLFINCPMVSVKHGS